VNFTRPDGPERRLRRRCVRLSVAPRNRRARSAAGPRARLKPGLDLRRQRGGCLGLLCEGVDQASRVEDSRGHAGQLEQSAEWLLHPGMPGDQHPQAARPAAVSIPRVLIPPHRSCLPLRAVRERATERLPRRRLACLGRPNAERHAGGAALTAPSAAVKCRRSRRSSAGAEARPVSPSWRAHGADGVTWYKESDDQGRVGQAP
jgi:hypothetical protein